MRREKDLCAETFVARRKFPGGCALARKKTQPARRGPGFPTSARSRHNSFRRTTLTSANICIRKSRANICLVAGNIYLTEKLCLLRETSAVQPIWAAGNERTGPIGMPSVAARRRSFHRWRPCIRKRRDKPWREQSSPLRR